MPSAKAYRAAERKRISNAPLRSRAKTSVTALRRLVEANDLEEAEKAAHQAVVALDKAAQKGAIHRRNAARRKSRLMRRLNRARSE